MQGLGGTDGASSMTGIQENLAAYFKRKNATLVQIHCIGH